MGPQIIQILQRVFNDNYRVDKYFKAQGFDKLPDGVPLTHIQGFTLLGKFYSIWFEIVIKVKLSHAKDIDIHIPIIVCPLTKSQAHIYSIG